MQITECRGFRKVRAECCGWILEIAWLTYLISTQIQYVKCSRFFQPLDDNFDTSVLQVAVVKHELLDWAHRGDERGKVIGALQVQIVVRQVKSRYCTNVVLKWLHDGEGFARFQAIVYEDDSKHGEGVPLDGLGHRVCSHRCRKILVGEINYRILCVFNQKSCSR